MAEQDKFALLKAAYRGDVQAVKGHLRSYTADVRGVRNCTCLHAAACSVNSEVVDVLLEEGGDVNWSAADGATPLHVAAAAGNSHVADRLLQNPLVDRDKRLDSSGFTALHLAVTSGDSDTVAVLLKAGATFDYAKCKGVTPLHLAADLGAEGILGQLLNSHLDFSKDQAPTALHFACSVPRFDTVAPALQVLSCVDWMGPLPLNPELLQAVVCATEQHHLESVIPKALHEQSFIAANLKNVQQVKSQRIHRKSIAVRQSMSIEEEEPPAQKSFLSGILKSLGCGGWVAPNASKSPKARAKELPVASTLEQEPHVATWMQQIDSLQANRFSRCAQMLISWGCKVDARTADGHSPLMYAAQACDLPLVSLLLEEKARVLELDDQQRNALHWCVNSPGPDSPQAQETCNLLIAMLIDHGIEVNSLDGAHCNPLQIACSHGNVVGTKALCKYGAQPDEKSLLAAVGSRDDHSRLSIVRYLLDIAAMEPSIHGSQASVIANQAVSNGPADAAALILQRQKAKGTTVTIPDSSWLQAAEHVTDDDPLLQHFPLKIPATAVAIGRAWRTRKDRRISGSSQGGFSDDGSDERQHQQLPHSTTTDLLKRVCKATGFPPVDEHGNTLLHLAVMHADRAEVSFLAKHRVLCSTKNSAGDLPVHILLREHASGSTLLPWVTQLMAGGVSADMPDGLGVPMLCYAAEAGKTEVLKWLLDSNAYASVADTDGRGPLHYAAKGSIHRVEAVRETYDLPSLVNTGTAAPSIGRRSTAPQHPVAAQPTNGRRSTDDKGQAGVSLFQALKDVATAYANIIDLLVERGARVTVTDLTGNTPVHEASTGAKIDIIKQLVAKGADLSIANKAGETCLHVAARHKSTQTVSYLVKEGAPLEVEDPNGRTPLHYACYYSSAEVISGLCRLKANVNHVDKKRRTPLHVVVYRKHAGTHAYGTHSLPSCRALVQHGAHINEPDSKMRTPLVLAYMFNHIRVAHYLWGRGAEPERSYGHHSRLFKQALQISVSKLRAPILPVPTKARMQVADISLVKHLLVNSRTLEVYHKDPSGASFLEVVIKELQSKPFIAYSDCVDNLLGLRVPITLPALAGLWYHIAARAERIGWVIDEEYNPEQEAKEASKGPRRRSLSGDGGNSNSAKLKAELEALNSKVVPVGAAEISKSVLSMSTGSAVRVSVGPDRLLAPVLEQDQDDDNDNERKDEEQPVDPMPPGDFQDAYEVMSSNGSVESGPEAVSNSVSSLPPRSPPRSGQLRGSDEPASILLSKHSKSGEISPNHVKFDAAETVPVDRKEPPDGRKGALASKLSKSTGSANVQSTFSVSPMRRMSAGSSTAVQGTEVVHEMDQYGDDDVDFDTLASTPSGLQALRWNVALGELLAHESDLILPRPVVIKSLHSALRASSMMLVQWRVDTTAVKAKLPETGETALHVAVKCEMWVAAAELLRRGADTCVTDKAGLTPLDAAVNKLCSREIAATLDLSATAEEKVEAIRSCFKFKRLPESRKSCAEHFLNAHLPCDGTSMDDAFTTAPDSDN